MVALDFVMDYIMEKLFELLSGKSFPDTVSSDAIIDRQLTEKRPSEYSF